MEKKPEKRFKPGDRVVIVGSDANSYLGASTTAVIVEQHPNCKTHKYTIIHDYHPRLQGSPCYNFNEECLILEAIYDSPLLEALRE